MLEKIKKLKSKSTIVAIILSLLIIIGGQWTKGYDFDVIWIGTGISLVLFLFYLMYEEDLLINYIPRVWTGLGVLFTFYVLYIHLNDIGVKYDPENPEELRLFEVIGNLSSAFSTSIIGVSFSLGFSIIIKIFKAIEEDYKKSLVKDYLSPEETLKAVLFTNNEIKNILTRLEQPAKDIWDVIKNNLNTPTKDLERNLRAISSKLGTLDPKTHTYSLLKEMSGKIDKPISDIDSKLSSLYINIVATNSAIEGISTAFSEEISQALATLVDHLKKNTKLDHIVEKVFEKEDSNLKGLVKSLTDLQTTSNTAIGDVNTAITDLGTGVNTAFKGLGAEVNTAFNGISTEMGKIEKAIGGLDSTLEAFDDKVEDKFDEVLSNNLNNLESYLKRIGKIASKQNSFLQYSAYKFESAIKQYNDFKDGNTELLETLNEQVQETTGLIRTNHELVESLKAYDEVMQQIKKRINAFSNVVDELQQINMALNQNKG